MATEKQLQKLAKTTRLEINDYDKYLKLMNKDLQDVAGVLKINTEGYKGLTNPYDMILRQNIDEITEGGKSKELMQNAPQSLYNYFVVPKIIDKEN